MSPTPPLTPPIPPPPPAPSQVTSAKQGLVLPHQVMQWFPALHTISFDNRLRSEEQDEAWTPERFGLLVSLGMKNLPALTTVRFSLTGSLLWLPFTHMALLLSTCTGLTSLSFPAMLFDGALKVGRLDFGWTIPPPSPLPPRLVLSSPPPPP